MRDGGGSKREAEMEKLNSNQFKCFLENKSLL